MNGLNQNEGTRGRCIALGLITSGLIFCFAFSSSAQADGGWKTTGWIGYEGQAETDLDNVDADFEFWNIGGGLKSQTMLTDSLKMSIGGDYRAVGYNFGGFSPFSDPWGKLEWGNAYRHRTADPGRASASSTGRAACRGPT